MTWFILLAVCFSFAWSVLHEFTVLSYILAAIVGLCMFGAWYCYRNLKNRVEKIEKKQRESEGTDDE